MSKYLCAEDCLICRVDFDSRSCSDLRKPAIDAHLDKARLISSRMCDMTILRTRAKSTKEIGEKTKGIDFCALLPTELDRSGPNFLTQLIQSYVTSVLPSPPVTDAL